MSLQYCGNCKTYHEPGEGYYWGPTYSCYQETPPADAAIALLESLDKKMSELQNTVWGLEKKVNKLDEWNKR